MTKKYYIILQDSTLLALQHKVNDKLKEGFELVGGPAATSIVVGISIYHYFFQALIKYEK